MNKIHLITWSFPFKVWKSSNCILLANLGDVPRNARPITVSALAAASLIPWRNVGLLDCKWVIFKLVWICHNMLVGNPVRSGVHPSPAIGCRPPGNPDQDTQLEEDGREGWMEGSMDGFFSLSPCTSPTSSSGHRKPHLSQTRPGVSCVSNWAIAAVTCC